MIAVSASASFILTTAARSATPCAGASRTGRRRRPRARAAERPAPTRGSARRSRAASPLVVALRDRLTVGRLRPAVLGSRLGGFTHRPSACQTLSRPGCRRSTIASSRPAPPTASRGGRSAGSGGGVLMRARVAAADVPARQAHPQVRPGVLAEFGAFLAAARRQGLRLGASQPRRGARMCCGAGGAFTSRCRVSPPHADQG